MLALTPLKCARVKPPTHLSDGITNGMRGPEGFYYVNGAGPDLGQCVCANLTAAFELVNAHLSGLFTDEMLARQPVPFQSTGK